MLLLSIREQLHDYVCAGFQCHILGVVAVTPIQRLEVRDVLPQLLITLPHKSDLIDLDVIQLPLTGNLHQNGFYFSFRSAGAIQQLEATIIEL